MTAPLCQRTRLFPHSECLGALGTACAGRGKARLALWFILVFFPITGWAQEVPEPSQSVQLSVPVPLTTPVLYPSATLDTIDDGPVDLLAPFSDPADSEAVMESEGDELELQNTDSSTLDLDELRQSKDRRYRELKQRIDVLLEQIKTQREGSVEPNDEAPLPPPPGIAAPAADNEAADNEDGATTPESMPSQEDAIEGLFEPNSASTESQSPEPTRDEPVPELPSNFPAMPQGLAVPGTPSQVERESWAEGLVDGPIDRLALADSLYGAGEIELALAMYREVDTSSFATTERRWVDYQIACCLRRLGAYAESIEVHRRLVGEAADDWITNSSRWWLDAIEERQGLEEELNALKSHRIRVREMIDADASIGVGGDTRAASRTE